jgi:hypothetical protein
MSRPLKLKVTGTVLCSVFQLPDHGFIGQFAGAHRSCFALSELDGLRNRLDKRGERNFRSGQLRIQTSFFTNTLDLLRCGVTRTALRLGHER